MQIEMHTAATKTPLQELGGGNEKIAALASMDTIVHFEIKELGQHTLACIVQYRTPQGESREFSKYYKFPVRKRHSTSHVCTINGHPGDEPPLCQD